MSHLDALFHRVHTIDQATDEWIKEQGISYNLFAIMYEVHMRPDCTQKRIAEHWLLPKQTVSTLCKQLEAQGLLRMEGGGGHDRREKILQLTEQGRALALPVLDAVAAKEQAAFQAFGSKKTQQLLDLLGELGGLIELQNSGR